MYIQYTTRMDQHSMTYNCRLDRERSWVSSHPSYYTPIDQNNATMTASLTAYWQQAGLTTYTIENNAQDWITLDKYSDANKALYVTGIGLYNNDDELLAVAKTRLPIPSFENFDTNFIVKLNF